MATTLFDKIWDAHELGGSDSGLLYIDLHLVHEVTSPQAFDGLRLAGRRVRRPDRTLATADHNTPTDGTPVAARIKDQLSRVQVETLERNCEEFGVPVYSLGSERQGIVHLPQHVELELQYRQGAFLLGARAEACQCRRQAELHVAPRQTHAALEVLQARRVDPRVVLRPGGQSLFVDLGREQFRERGAHTFRPGRAPGEVHVRIDGEAHAGAHLGEALHDRARKADRLGQAQPRVDPA